MAKLLKMLNPEISVYKDRRFEGDEADWERALRTSTTLYIGNLSFYTREEQIYEVFSKCGHIDRIIVGLDKLNKTPCGFAFVIYYARADAEAAVRYLSGTVLDDRAIRVDHDWGFMEGRQWGRGRSGGQVRDEFRLDYDPGRGGYGKVVQKEITNMQQKMVSGSMTSSPAFTAPAGKRQRMDGPGQGQGGYGGRGRDDTNPRFADRGRRADSDDDDRD